MLADALWYARREGATHVLDLATLTGRWSSRSAICTQGSSRTTTNGATGSSKAGERSGDLVWPFPMHPRYRRYVDSTYADMKNASLLRQGSPVLAAKFLEEFAGEGPWAHIDMAGPGLLRALARRLSPRSGWHGLRRAADRRARRELRVNYELTDEQELDPADGARVRAVARRAGRRGARPRGAVPLRARRGARRARLDGNSDPRGVRRRRRRHRVVRDRDRRADAHRLVRGDHRRRAHVSRHDADLPVRQRRAEAGVAAAARLGREARRVRVDGA